MKRAGVFLILFACLPFSASSAQDSEQLAVDWQEMSRLESDCNEIGAVGEQFDWMDTRNFRLIDYRRLFLQSQPPSPDELVGQWRGVNKGIVTLVGYRQFIKEVQPCGQILIGDNIEVEQVSENVLRCFGWQPKFDEAGQLLREGKFVVYPPGRRKLQLPSAFDHGAEINYRDGGNRRSDPVRLLVDRVVKLDNDHLLGRATARFGICQIPLAYFILERVSSGN